MDEVFARVAGAGLETVRWFLFCDGRAGVRFDAGGRPAGIDELVFRDMDTALGAAASRDLELMFVLFDFLWCSGARVTRGVRLGGHRRTIARADARNALIERVALPVMARYGREPVVAAWDLFNEPEWVTLGYSAFPLSTSGWVRPRAMKGFFREISAAAHGLVSQPLTVGLASARGLPLVTGCGLDLYQVHWYDRRERRSPLASPPMADLDRPLLLGEFPSAGSRRTIPDLLATARASGYCGALAWSASARDGSSDLSAIERAMDPGQPGNRSSQ